MNSPRPQRRGLGRGLGSLIPTTAPSVEDEAPRHDSAAASAWAAGETPAHGGDDTGPELAPVAAALWPDRRQGRPIRAPDHWRRAVSVRGRSTGSMESLP